MDNDEVKAALQRIEVANGFARGYLNDLSTLAAAYAAEHPADEDEPITPEWLNGLLPWDDREATDRGNVVEWRIYHAGHELEVDLCCDWFTLTINGNRWPMPLYTRGQLRRLLKELEA